MGKFNPLKLSEDDVLQLFREEAIYVENDKVIFETVEEGKWIDDGKYSDMELIFKDRRTGKTYSCVIIRSGSYFTDYHFEVFDNPVEVHKVTETITVEKWVKV